MNAPTKSDERIAAVVCTAVWAVLVVPAWYGLCRGFFDRIVERLAS